MAKTKRPPQTRKKLGGPRVGEGGPRKSKVDAVTEIESKLSSAAAVILTEYRGMTVHELAELRASLHEAGTDYKVYKNTLASIAARNAGLEALDQHLQGPTAFAFADGDPVVTAKKLSEFAKRVPTLVLKGGILSGRILSTSDVKALSTLESREVLLAKTAGMFLSPIQQLANTFAAALNQVGSLFAQLRDKLPADGAAPAAEEPAAEEPAAEEPAAEAAPEAEAPGTEDQA